MGQSTAAAEVGSRPGSQVGGRAGHGSAGTRATLANRTKLATAAPEVIQLDAIGMARWNGELVEVTSGTKRGGRVRRRETLMKLAICLARAGVGEDKIRTLLRERERAWGWLVDDQGKARAGQPYGEIAARAVRLVRAVSPDPWSNSVRHPQPPPVPQHGLDALAAAFVLGVILGTGRWRRADRPWRGRALAVPRARSGPTRRGLARAVRQRGHLADWQGPASTALPSPGLTVATGPAGPMAQADGIGSCATGRTDRCAVSSSQPDSAGAQDRNVAELGPCGGR